MKFDAARLSEIIVGLVIGAVLLYVGWLVLPTKALAWLAILLLLYEGWTLVNHYSDDTLSEAVARLTAAQPLVTWLFGFAQCYVTLRYALPTVLLGDSEAALSTLVLLSAMMLLQGHFFFSMKSRVARAEEARVEKAAETGTVPPKNGSA